MVRSVGLQALVRDQLIHRDTQLAVPLRIGEILPGVADCQDVDRLQIGGK